MNRAQRRKLAKQAQGRGGTAKRNLPMSRINQAIAGRARDNVLEIVGQGRVPDRALEIATSAFFLADHLIRRFEAEPPPPPPRGLPGRLRLLLL